MKLYLISLIFTFNIWGQCLDDAYVDQVFRKKDRPFAKRLLSQKRELESKVKKLHERQKKLLQDRGLAMTNELESYEIQLSILNYKLRNASPQEKESLLNSRNSIREKIGQLQNTIDSFYPVSLELSSQYQSVLRETQSLERDLDTVLQKYDMLYRNSFQ